MNNGLEVTPWSKLREDRLKELVKRRNWTSADVVKTLNLEFPDLKTLTKNAVLGKLKRINDATSAAKRLLVRPHTRLNPTEEYRSKKHIISTQSLTNPTENNVGACIPQSNMLRVEDTDEVRVHRRHVAYPPGNKQTVREAKNTPVPLSDIKPGMCVWPLGDPDVKGFGYCGRPAIKTSPRNSYCAEHDAIAHPPKASRHGRQEDGLATTRGPKRGR